VASIGRQNCRESPPLVEPAWGQEGWRFVTFEAADDAEPDSGNCDERPEGKIVFMNSGGGS